MSLATTCARVETAWTQVGGENNAALKKVHVNNDEHRLCTSPHAKTVLLRSQNNFLGDPQDHKPAAQALAILQDVVNTQIQMMKLVTDPKLLEMYLEYVHIRYRAALDEGSGDLLIADPGDGIEVDLESEKQRLGECLIRLVRAHGYDAPALTAAMTMQTNKTVKLWTGRAMEYSENGEEWSDLQNCEDNRTAIIEGYLDMKEQDLAVPQQDDFTAWVVNMSRATTGVERILGEAKEMRRRRLGFGECFLRDLVQLRKFDPREGKDLISRNYAGALADSERSRRVRLAPTRFLKRSVRIWRKNYGARFNINSKIRKDRNKQRGMRSGSKNWQRAQRLSQMDMLCAKEAELQESGKLEGEGKLKKVATTEAKLAKTQPKAMAKAVARFAGYQAKRFNEEAKRYKPGQRKKKNHMTEQVKAAVRSRVLGKKKDVATMKLRIDEELAKPIAKVFIHERAAEQIGEKPLPA